MKQKRKHILKKLLIFGIAFLLVSCSEDLYDEGLNANKHAILVQRKNFEDLKKNKKLMKSIERFTMKVDNSLQRQHYDSINNFYIDLDDVMFTLDSLNHKTYTFKVSRLPDNGLFENLILKTSKDGGFDAILAQYNQTILNSNLTIPQEIQNSINQNVTFTYLGKKTLSEINSKFSYNEECFEPGYVYVTTAGSTCASGHHSFNEGSDCDYWGTTAMATPGTSGYVFTMVGVACDNGGNSGGEDFSTGPHGGGGSNLNDLILNLSNDYVVPCPGDPVKNPKICPSSAGNTKGGTFGCTRNANTICGGVTGKKKHGGVDVDIPILEIISNMHSGTVVAKRTSFDYNQYVANSLGNFVEIESVINGETIRIKYCHLGYVAPTVTGFLSQGFPFALTGKSGNAAAKGVKPHLHLQAKKKVGDSWVEIDPLPLFDTNFNPTTFQPNGSKSNCN